MMLIWQTVCALYAHSLLIRREEEYLWKAGWREVKKKCDTSDVNFSSDPTPVEETLSRRYAAIVHVQPLCIMNTPPKFQPGTNYFNSSERNTTESVTDTNTSPILQNAPVLQNRHDHIRNLIHSTNICRHSCHLKPLHLKENKAETIGWYCSSTDRRRSIVSQLYKKVLVNKSDDKTTQLTCRHRPTIGPIIAVSGKLIGPMAAADIGPIAECRSDIGPTSRWPCQQQAY